ncbi:FAD-binding oxidoreductase [Actinocorallia longicatena]|uniref:FAD-binding oxidoreductase n=1 Tax=Actinocorallia longicatena TaxID=111803 RepID=A0ABP6QN20_9ACTN
MLDSRPVTDDDAILGVRPRYVAEPSTVAEAAAVMRAAGEQGLSVVPRGNGTRIHWGAAPRACDLVIDTRRLGRIVEHAAGDLVVTVEAGVPVADLQALLARENQQLALDVPIGAADGPGSTVGGVISAGVAGPRRLLYGTVRDLLIGITVVRADGAITKSGGKVVKNVAGYDLGKLYTGAFGTLGLVVSASFRLHPVPEQRRYVTTLTKEPLRDVLRILHSDLVPSAVELKGPDTLVTLLEGSAADARAAEAVRLLGRGTEVSDTPPDWWLRHPKGEVLLEVRAKPTDLPAILELAGARVRGSAGSGVWLIGAFAVSAPDLVARLRERWPTIVRYAPEAVRDTVDLWGPSPALPLMRRVKDQFDPAHRLSPGRFVGGI